MGSSGWEIIAEDKNQWGAQDGRLWPRIKNQWGARDGRLWLRITSGEVGMGDDGGG
jgi:hypothetical protein